LPPGSISRNRGGQAVPRRDRQTDCAGAFCRRPRMSRGHRRLAELARRRAARLAPYNCRLWQRSRAVSLPFLTDHLGVVPGVADLAAPVCRRFSCLSRPTRRRGPDREFKGCAGHVGAARVLFSLPSIDGAWAHNPALATVRSPKLPVYSLPKPLTAAEAAGGRWQASMTQKPWIAKRDIAVLTLLYGWRPAARRGAGPHPPRGADRRGRDPHYRQGQTSSASFPILPIVRGRGRGLLSRLSPTRLPPMMPCSWGRAAGSSTRGSSRVRMAQLRRALGLPEIGDAACAPS